LNEASTAQGYSIRSVIMTHHHGPPLTEADGLNLINAPLPKSGLDACISSRITTVIQVVSVFDKRKTEIFPFEIPNSSKRSERNESFDLQELMKIQVSQGFPRSTRGFISLPLLFLLRKQKKKRIEISSPSKCVYRQQDSLPRRIGLDPRQLKFVNSFAFAASATKEKKERPIEVETYRSAQSTHTGPRGKTKSYVYIYKKSFLF